MPSNHISSGRVVVCCSSSLLLELLDSTASSVFNRTARLRVGGLRRVLCPDALGCVDPAAALLAAVGSPRLLHLAQLRLLPHPCPWHDFVWTNIILDATTNNIVHTDYHFSRVMQGTSSPAPLLLFGSLLLPDGFANSTSLGTKRSK